MTTPPGQPGVPAPLTLAQIQQMAQSGGNNAMASVSPTIGNAPTGASLIYMGRSTVSAPLTGAGRDIAHGMPSVTENNLTYDQARLLPATWLESDPNMLKKFVTTGILNKAPGFNPGMGIGDILSAWDDLVKTAWVVNQRSDGKKQWTPWDVLNTYGNPKGNYGTIRQGDWLYDASTGQKVKYVGPRSKTTTSRDVSLSSAEDVKALTTQVLTQALGRAPTATEVAQYKSTINAQQEANPTLTTTTQTLNDRGEVASQSSQTSGGLSSAAQQQLVQDKVTGMPEFAKYQSGTTYWNALMQMLTGG